MLVAAFRFVLKNPPQLASMSGGVEELLGFKPEDWNSGKVQLRDRVHAGDAELAEFLFSPNLQRPSETFNIRLRHADGKIRCIRGTFTKTRSSMGEVELELNLADARTVSEPGDSILINSFRALIEQTEDFVYIKNRNHVILAASRGIPGLTDGAMDRTELVGTTDYDNHPEEMADVYYQLEERAFAGGERVNQIQQVRMQDGSMRWIDNRKYPVGGPEGHFIGIFGVAPDITEAVKTREKLIENEGWLRDAQEIAGLSSYVLDIPNRKWIVSEELAALLGIGKDYDRGFEQIWPLIHPDDRPAMAKRLEGYFSGELNFFDSEYRILRHTDGAVRWVHTRGRLERDARGNPVALRGTAQDITERKQAEAALSESRDLLQLFIQHAPVALAMFDREMRYVAVSRRWLEMHSLLDREVIGHSQYEIFPEVPESWRQEHRRCIAGEEIPAEDRRLLRSDGSEQWVRREVRPWRSGDGSIGGIVIFGEDITERKRAEERLQLAASVFTGAREGITITDLNGTILDVNDSFTRITGYSREEVLGKNPRLLKSGLQSKEFYEKMWSALQCEGHWSGEIWNRSKNGDIFAESLTINAIRAANGQPTQYAALFSDITDVKRHEQQLEHIAHYDPLTGLPNRVLLTNRLRQAMAQALRNKQMLAVAYFDLDGFKAINDRHGHSVGDALLTAIAFRLRRVMREGDTLGRLGGDEFAAVLLDVTDPESVGPAVKRMLEAAADEVQIGDVYLRASACCGVTYYPQSEEVDADVLLRQAGQAMYQAKLAGKNRSQDFDASQDLMTRSRHENLEHIRQALAARQFVLHYQPKVNMRTGRIIGAEALLRWQHPERGLLPPGMFLPVIEEHPLTIELGDWVIESVLGQIESWQADGLEIPVSVNLSALELQQPDFADRLRRRLAEHPLVKPSMLEFEILETSALQDLAQSSHVVAACRELGVSVALDDFGIGYSSLTYLKRLPANVIKIDQSFVRDMLDDPENLNILEGILGLAAAFRREVIAEGVETVEHGLMLLQMGCELAQGYGVARPMPANALSTWAATWHPDPKWAEVPPVHGGNRNVLYACVEHHAWLSAFEACLLGKRTSPPPLDAGHCRIGTWLRTEKQSARGTFASIQAIETLHQELHALAAEILAARSEGPHSEGPARLQQLHYLHEKCLSRLKAFTRNSFDRSRKHSRKAPARHVARN
jgi:diguanylate cyclase (GGDEF)-like protein/PAS domain S-box-containing protein